MQQPQCQMLIERRFFCDSILAYMTIDFC